MDSEAEQKDKGSGMTGAARSSWRSLQRGTDRIFDAVSVRPVGMLVFAASVTLLLYLQVGVQGSIRAQAVAHATQVDHPARVASFVTKVYVQQGDQVDAGAPLVDLSSHFIDREVSRIDAEVEKLLHESQLAQARLIVKEQRWVEPEMRMRPDRPSLEKPTEALFAKEIAVLQTRRNQLLEDRSGLTIRATDSGRILAVALPGSAVAAASSVASISPEYAREIIAYVPAATPPTSIAAGIPVDLGRSGGACGQPAKVLRRGAGVQEAPGQLRGLLRFPVHGMPVYISIPENCRLGIGQVLSVEFPRSVM